MSRTSFASLAPGRGQRARGWLTVPGVTPPWEIPAWVIRGAQDGPSLALMAGLHAAEYTPIEAVTRLCRSVDPGALRGTILAASLVNMPGFYERSLYVNPRDGKNLNRVFPGSAQGTASERVARFLTDELIAGADAFVDLHCGDLVEALVPFTLYGRTGRAGVDTTARAMAEAYGLDYLLAADLGTVPGAAYATAASMGIPALIAEVGQQGIHDGAAADRHVRGLRNVLSRLGMMAGAEPDARTPVVLGRSVWMRTDLSCTYHPTVTVGDQVRQGQPVGELRDVFGETLRVLEAPASGVVLFLVTSLAVKDGDPLLGVGVP